MEKRGLDLGHLSKEDTGTRTLLQLISKCLAPAFGQRIDLHKATSQDEFASLHSPCVPLVQPALDMLLDFRLTVSATTIKLGMKASEGCQGRGMEEKEGVGTVCQPRWRMDCTEMGSLSQTPLGSPIASNKENTSLHPFEQGGPLYPHN